jgi:hypothetical protein
MGITWWGECPPSPRLHQAFAPPPIVSPIHPVAPIGRFFYFELEKKLKEKPRMGCEDLNRRQDY